MKLISIKTIILALVLVLMPVFSVGLSAKGKQKFTETELSFTNNSDNISLAGTLTMPALKAGKKCPAVVLISGSGPNDRDEQMDGHAVFKSLAHHLSSQGIAVLRYDDRGVGQSGGEYHSASLSEFYNDAMAAVAYLKAIPQVSSVGVIGHSEGGFIGIEMAAYQEVDFLITLAGGGKTGKEILLDQRRALLTANGAKKTVIDRYLEYMAKAQEVALSSADKATCALALRDLFMGSPLAGDEEATAAQLCNPEMIGMLQFDPYIMYPEIVCPTLILNGTLDVQVTAENAEVMNAEMLKAGNKDVTLRIYDGMNHLFQMAKSGLPQEYSTLGDCLCGDVLNDISTWILKRFK